MIYSEDYRMVVKEIVAVQEQVNRPLTSEETTGVSRVLQGSCTELLTTCKCLYDLLAVKSETPASGKRRPMVAMQLSHQKVIWEDAHQIALE